MSFSTRSRLATFAVLAALSAGLQTSDAHAAGRDCKFAASTRGYGAVGSSATLLAQGGVPVTTPAEYDTDYTITIGLWVDEAFAQQNPNAPSLALSYFEHMNCIYAYGEAPGVDASHRVSFRIADHRIRLYNGTTPPLGYAVGPWIQEVHHDWDAVIAALGPNFPEANLMFSTDDIVEYDSVKGIWSVTGGASNGVGQGHAIVRLDPGALDNTTDKPYNRDWWGVIASHEMGHALGHEGHVPTLYDTMCCSGMVAYGDLAGRTRSRDVAVADRTWRLTLDDDTCDLDTYADPYQYVPNPYTGAIWDPEPISWFLDPTDEASIWRYTGVPCQGTACNGWQQLDFNGRTVQLAATPNALYQLHLDGAIWRYTGVPCSGGGCTGWQMLGDDPDTVAITASGSLLYRLQDDGGIWAYSGLPCVACDCVGWLELDHNQGTEEILAAGSDLYQRHVDGSLWRYTGQPCSGGVCNGWQKIDDNPATVAIAGSSAYQLYQLHDDGEIWQFNGTACSGSSCPGWVKLDDNPRTVALAATNGKLYQLHDDGALWRYTGVPCQGQVCNGWQLIDDNPATSAITADGGQLWQLHDDGDIWRFTGAVCTATSCPGWQHVDHNPRAEAIVAGGSTVYQLHRW